MLISARLCVMCRLVPLHSSSWARSHLQVAAVAVPRAAAAAVAAVVVVLVPVLQVVMMVASTGALMS